MADWAPGRSPAPSGDARGGRGGEGRGRAALGWETPAPAGGPWKERKCARVSREALALRLQIANRDWIGSGVERRVEAASTRGGPPTVFQLAGRDIEVDPNLSGFPLSVSPRRPAL